jgi:hypothetical protein
LLLPDVNEISVTCIHPPLLENGLLLFTLSKHMFILMFPSLYLELKG